MRIVYQGEREGTEAYGLRFPFGVPVEIDEATHPLAARKLANNQHFRVIVEEVSPEVMDFEAIPAPGETTPVIEQVPARKKPGPKPKAKAE